MYSSGSDIIAMSKCALHEFSPNICSSVSFILRKCSFYKFLISIRSQYTANGIAEEKAEPLIPEHSTTALSWGEYLGIYAPTLTVTKLILETTTVQDARVMVTYAIRGCKPVKLPLDLMVCPQEDTNAFSIQDIIPTSTVSMASSTVPPDFEKTNELIADNEEPLNEDQSATPTEALPF